jgi:acyl-CoA synthetase (NDP forming)
MDSCDITGELLKGIGISQRLFHLFEPKCVAVVGASDKPEKLGYHVMKSLTKGGYRGRVVPVNPGSRTVFGLECRSRLTDYPGEIDLAIIAVPAAGVPYVFEQCGSKAVKAAVLISAGFKEIEDPEGEGLQEQVANLANRMNIPVIGPNTFGLINLTNDLNASFTPEFSLLRKGGVTLVSQSGGISHLMGFLAMKDNVGMSKIVGLGNRLNVDFADLLPYLVSDEKTRAIALYIEGLDDPRELLREARSLRGKKPIVAYKAGAGTRGDEASRSHTGTLAGRSEIYEGALRQSGIVTVNGPQALLDAAKALSICPRLEKGKVAVLTGQAGPGMVASDVCEAAGLEMAVFSRETQEVVNRLLPPIAMRTNPVDMGPAWYDAEAIRGIVETVLEDKAVGGILILMMFASANREAVPRLSELLLKWRHKKPLITCFLSPEGIWDQAVATIEEAGAAVNFPTPERAAAAMAALWNYAELNKDTWR